MARNLELLLLESVDSLGIVGDVVRVKRGFARNYLLPMGLAEFPTPKKLESLKEARAKALAEIAALRSQREATIVRLGGISIKLVRSCNSNGMLYGSVTQRDVSDALAAIGHDVGMRAVRLPASIRRAGEYHVPIQFERDLKAEITLIIESDQPIELSEGVEVDEEGEMIVRKPGRERKAQEPAAAAAPAAASDAAPAAEAAPKAKAKAKSKA